jgi:molybdopterin converting factor small subunit
MLIKVARLGNAVTEVALTSGSTVESALTAADLAVDNEEIRVNNSSASLSQTLRDGDIVTLVPKVKGGQKIVKVARLGNAVVTVAVAEDATVQDALDAADITVENEDIRIDEHSADSDDRIGSGNLITIVPKVKGGK